VTTVQEADIIECIRLQEAKDIIGCILYIFLEVSDAFCWMR